MKLITKFILLTLFCLPLSRAADITMAVTELRAIQSVAQDTQGLSTALDVSTYLSGTMYLDFATLGTNTNGTELRIEVASGNLGGDCATTPEDCLWTKYWSTITSKTAPGTDSLDATEPAGETSIAESDTTGLTDGSSQIVYIFDDTLSSSEWAKVTVVATNTTWTIQDGLQNEHTTADAWWAEAERFVVSMDLTSIMWVRAVCNNNKVGTVTVNWRARFSAATDIE